MVYDLQYQRTISNDFDESLLKGQKWVCWPTTINGLGLERMGLFSVLREPNDRKDWGCVTTGAAGYGCALCISRCAIYIICVLNDAPPGVVQYTTCMAIHDNPSLMLLCSPNKCKCNSSFSSTTDISPSDF